jgi:hypothetical protein
MSVTDMKACRNSKPLPENLHPITNASQFTDNLLATEIRRMEYTDFHIYGILKAWNILNNLMADGINWYALGELSTGMNLSWLELMYRFSVTDFQTS